MKPTSWPKRPSTSAGYCLLWLRKGVETRFLVHLKRTQPSGLNESCKAGMQDDEKLVFVYKYVGARGTPQGKL